jgi:hypothetical protein
MKPSIFTYHALVLMLLSGVAHGAPLLGWYRFDDPLDLGKDYSGNNNNGTIVDNGAAPIYTGSGYVGGAADFRGGGKIDIPFNTGPTLWPNLTWGGWVLPDAVNNVRTIVNNDDGGYDRALNIDFRAEGNYAAFVNNGPFPYNSGVAPSTSAWTFIAGVYQNNFYGTGQGRLTMYVGNQRFDNIQTFYGPTGWTYTSIGGSPTFGEFWDGKIDDFFVIGGAASPSEMAQIMNDPNSVPAVAVAVPEPFTYAMALAGLACGGYLVRRRRKRA